MKRKAIPKKTRDQLLVLSKNACMICRVPHAVSHHIEPISEGGDNEWMNLIVLCPNCHHRVHVTKEIKTSQLLIYRQQAEEGKLGYLANVPTNVVSLLAYGEAKRQAIQPKTPSERSANNNIKSNFEQIINGDNNAQTVSGTSPAKKRTKANRGSFVSRVLQNIKGNNNTQVIG